MSNNGGNPEAVIAERAARNQATFRDANERIEAAAEKLDEPFPEIPVICECPDRRCTAVLRIEPREYEEVRAHPARFLAAPGHEVCEVDGVTVARIVEQRERFSVMEKLGIAGEVARDLDPRGVQADG